MFTTTPTIDDDDLVPGSRSAVPLLYDEEDLSANHTHDRRFVWALARGLEVLRAFEHRPGPLGVGEIAVRTGLPKPTVSRLTYTLAALGYLQAVDRQGRYEPTAALLTLGYPVLASLRVQEAAYEPMRLFADEAGAMVSLASNDRLSMVHIESMVPERLAHLRLVTGSRVSLAKSTMGRAYLAALDADRRGDLLERLKARHGADWPELKSRIEDGIAQVHARGFCIVDGEWRADVRSAGAPIVTRNGGTIMAMMVGAPGYSLDVSHLETDLGPRLVQLCRTVGLLLGR